MPVGSLSSSSLASAYLGSTDTLAPQKSEKAEKSETATVAAAAAADEEAPVRSANATQGTLVDTYL